MYLNFANQFTVKFKECHFNIRNSPEYSDKAGDNCKQHDRYKTQFQDKITKPVTLHQIVTFTQKIKSAGLRIVDVERGYQRKIQTDHNGTDYSGKNQQASDNNTENGIKGFSEGDNG